MAAVCLCAAVRLCAALCGSDCAARRALRRAGGDHRGGRLDHPDDADRVRERRGRHRQADDGSGGARLDRADQCGARRAGTGSAAAHRD
eukprot:4027724-Prymnesium_polylepis.1